MISIFLKRYFLFIFCIWAANCYSQNWIPSEATFKGNIPEFCDSIVIYVVRNPTMMTVSGSEKFSASSSGKKGWFLWNTSVLNHVGMVGIQFYLKGATFGNFYYVEPGDDIYISFERKGNGTTPFFSGKGAAKYNAQMMISTNFDEYSWVKYLNEVKESDTEFNLQRRKEFIEDSLIKFLVRISEYSDGISPPVYQMIKNDLIVDFYQDSWYSFIFEKYQNISNEMGKIKWLGETEPYMPMKTDKSLSKAIIFSPKYMSFLFREAIYCILLENKAKKINLDQLFLRINKQYSGLLRERLLYELCVSPEIQTSFAIDFDQSVLDSLCHVIFPMLTSEYLKSSLASQIRLTKGEPFYKFSMPDLNDSLVMLDQLAGKIVLFDMWSKGCGGCIVFANGFDKDVYPNIVDQDKFVVLSVNADNTKEKWVSTLNGVMTSQKRHINVQLNGKDFWSDPLVKYYNIQGLPFTVLIDEKGKVIYNNVVPLKPNELLQLINKAIKEIHK